MSNANVEGTAKTLMQGALSMISNVTNLQQNNMLFTSASKKKEGSVTTLIDGTETIIEDISKEDLVHLCMKLNKRMQNLEVKGQDLTRKKNKLIKERKELMEFLLSLPFIDPNCFQDEDIDIIHLYQNWRQYELSVVKVKDETISNSDIVIDTAAVQNNDSETYTEKLVIENDNSTDLVKRLESELENCRFNDAYLRSKIENLEISWDKSLNESENLKKHVDSLRSSSEEQVLYFQMQQNILIKPLKQRISQLEVELQEYNQRRNDHEKEYNNLIMLKVEQETLLRDTQNELHNAYKLIDTYQEKINSLENSLKKHHDLFQKYELQSKEINDLSLQLDEKASSLSRLRSEAQLNDQNYAIRAALLATYEAQLESMKIEITEKENIQKELLLTIEMLKLDSVQMIEKMNLCISNKIGEIDDLKSKIAELSKFYETQRLTAKQEYEFSYEAVIKDYTKKLNTAKQLIIEKEDENRVLLSKINDLQTEISSGAPTERKFFEYAEFQSKRDGMFDQRT